MVKQIESTTYTTTPRLLFILVEDPKLYTQTFLLLQDFGFNNGNSGRGVRIQSLSLIGTSFHLS
jgi:hypothetical protein